MAEDTNTRALVLGGGGVTGIAWEIGVLHGLTEAGVDLGLADAVIGTSAGAFTGAAVAGGHPIAGLYAAQFEPNTTEVSAAMPDELLLLWFGAYEEGGADPAAVGRAFGAIARANPEPVPMARRREAVAGRLLSTDFPPTLRVTATDADTGELHVLDHTSGLSLTDAVTASGAVPGVWPLLEAGGHTWIDGGMVSPTNARQADGFDAVLVLAPIPYAYGKIPGVADDVEALRAHGAKAILIPPDDESIEAIGPNLFDPERRGIVAEAGRAQGARIASEVLAIW